MCPMNPYKPPLVFLLTMLLLQAGCSFDTGAFDGLTCEEGVDKDEATRVCRNGVWEQRPTGLDQGGLPDLSQPSEMGPVPDMTPPKMDMEAPKMDMEAPKMDMDMTPTPDMCMALTQEQRAEVAAQTACGTTTTACEETIQGTLCDPESFCEGSQCKSCNAQCAAQGRTCGAVECNGQSYNCKNPSDTTVLENILCDGEQICGVDPSGNTQRCVDEVIFEAPGQDLGFGDGIDLDGEFLVVGAPSDEDVTRVGAGAKGSVFVYRRDEKTLGWTPMPFPQTPTNAQRFGAAVAIDAATKQLFVGAPDSGGGKGAVFLYELDATGVWTSRGFLEPADYRINDTARSPRAYGHALALSAEKLVVGAPLSPGRDDQSLNGRLFVYNRPTAFNASAFGTNPSIAAGNGDALMGWAVDISQDFIVVSVPGEDGDRGKAYLYDADNLSAAKGTLTTGFRAPSAKRFGFSVAIGKDASGATYSVYASMPPYDSQFRDIPGRKEDAGVVEYFSYNGSNNVVRSPEPLGKDAYILSGDLEYMYYGYDVDVEEELVVVGVPGQSAVEMLSTSRGTNPSSYVVTQRTMSGSSSFKFYQPSFATTHHVGHRVDVSKGIVAISAPSRDASTRDRVVLIRR